MRQKEREASGTGRLRRVGLRAASWVCFALSLASLLAVIPASGYIGDSAVHRTAQFADWFLLLAFLLPVAGLFAVLGVLFYRRSCNDYCQL